MTTVNLHTSSAPLSTQHTQPVDNQIVEDIKATSLVSSVLHDPALTAPVLQTRTIDIASYEPKAPTYMLLKKAAYYAFAFFFLLTSFITAPFWAIPRLISELYNKRLHADVKAARLRPLECFIGSLKNQLVQQDLQKLGGAYRTAKSTMDRRSFDKEIAAYASHVREIVSLIKGKKEPDEIRALINTAMKTDVYQTLKNGSCKGIEFLQKLSILFLSAHGEQLFIDYGKQCLGEQTQTAYSFGQLADLLDPKVHTKMAFQKNGAVSSTLWALSHPFETINCINSHIFPLEFYGHQQNPDLIGFTFTHPTNKSVQIPFYYGPGPTGDLLYQDGVLVYLDKLNRQGIHVHELRMNYQSIDVSAEKQRCLEIRKQESQHADSLHLLSISFDNEAMKMHSEKWTNFEDPKAFMKTYKEYVFSEEHGSYRNTLTETKKDNGFYVGPKVLEENVFEKAFDHSEKIFTNLSKNNAHWNALIENGEKGKARLGRMMQLGTHALISLGAVINSLDDRQSSMEQINERLDLTLDQALLDSRVSGACKQDIDRGIVENIALRLYFRLLSNPGALSTDEVYSIAGSVLARARMVEGRLILRERYEVLSDLLHFIGSKNYDLSDLIKEFAGLKTPYHEELVDAIESIKHGETAEEYLIS